jgi:hypothetical protein
MITLPGLILPIDNFSAKFAKGKFIFYTLNGDIAKYLYIRFSVHRCRTYENKRIYGFAIPCLTLFERDQ